MLKIPAIFLKVFLFLLFCLQVAPEDEFLRVSDWGFDTRVIQGLHSHGPEAYSCRTINTQNSKN